MVEIRYGDLVVQPGTVEVSGMGSQPGPVGGDGWSIVSRLLFSDSTMPSGAGRFAIVVSGKIGNIRVNGATPSRGVVQLCLGFDTGAKSPLHKVNLPAVDQLGAIEGIPFQFVVLMDAATLVTDPFFGGTFDPAGGANFVLWGRTYWNGDPLTYSVTFDVGDVSWLWWNMDAIPVADRLAEHYYPATPASLSTTLTGLYLTTNTPGNDGEKWLHFASVTYEPRVRNGLAPRFDFGVTNTLGSFTGYSAAVGTGGRWGQQRCLPVAGATEQVQLCQGAFWYQEQAGAIAQVGVRGADRQSTTATRVHRITYFAIKLDNLLDVLARTEAEVANATCNLVSAPFFPSVYVPLERPSTGVVSLPCVIAHGIVQTTGLQSFDCCMLTDRDRYLDFIDMAAQSDASRQEAVSVMSFSQNGFAPGQPDIQYRTLFLGGLNAPPVSLPVRDISIVQFYFVRDPSVLPYVPPSIGAPLLLQPGRESASPASLPALPFAPDGDYPEDSDREEARIDGATGYSRTWPLQAFVRRTISLAWSRLSAVDAKTLYEFLRDNPAFQLTPHRESTPIAVLQADQPVKRQVDAGVHMVTVRVVELIWTG